MTIDFSKYDDVAIKSAIVTLAGNLVTVTSMGDEMLMFKILESLAECREELLKRKTKPNVAANI